MKGLVLSAVCPQRYRDQLIIYTSLMRIPSLKYTHRSKQKDLSNNKQAHKSTLIYGLWSKFEVMFLPNFTIGDIAVLIAESAARYIQGSARPVKRF